jgi:hypothetical protein
MAGLFNRLKKWYGLDVVQNTDLNAEFDNIINNLGPSGMSGWEASIAQMRLQTSPGTYGSESLATSLSGELQQIRYQLNAIIGGADGVWYDQPALNLSQVQTFLPTAPPPNRIISGAVVATSLQPLHLVPSGGSTKTVVLKCTTVPFVVEINGTTYTFSSDITSPTLGLAPAATNTALVNDATNADGSNKTKGFGALVQDFAALADGSVRTLGEYPIYCDTVGASIYNLAGTYQAFSYVHSGVTEYFIGYITPDSTSTVTKLTKCLRGCFWNSTSAPVPAIGVYDDDTVTIMQLIWIYVTTSGTLLTVYTHPRYSGVQPASSASGDMWYDTVNLTWKQSNGASYSVANATLVGVAMTNGSGCVAARSFDWNRSYQNYSNSVVEWYSTSEYRTKYDTSLVSVYGSNIQFDRDTVRWTTSNVESGTTLTVSTTYFLYLSEVGATYVSQYAPLRRYDLGGFYHPYNSWRCLGMAYYNSSSHFDQYSLATMSNLNGEFLNDKSISVSKMKAAPTVLYDANASTPIVAGVDQVSFSTVAASNTITATSYTAVVDSNAKSITCGLVCTGRPVVVGLIPIGVNGYIMAEGTFNGSTGNSAIGAFEFNMDAGGTTIVGQFGASVTVTSVADVTYASPTLASFQTTFFGLAPGIHTCTFLLNCAVLIGPPPYGASNIYASAFNMYMYEL